MQYGAEKNIYNLKEELMAYLDNPSQRYKKYKFNQLRSKMCGELGYRVDMLREALKELELEGRIDVDSTKGLFRSFPHDLGYVHGVLSINKHDEGFIMGRDGKKYKIKTVVVAIPGVVQKDYSVSFGNRKWDNIDLYTPIKNLTKMG